MILDEQRIKEANEEFVALRYTLAITYTNEETENKRKETEVISKLDKPLAEGLTG